MDGTIGLTVLVAERDAVIGMWLEDTLCEGGLVPAGPFRSTSAALNALSETRFDLAVVGSDLEAGPCFPLACALRRSGTPFVLLDGPSRMVSAFADAPFLPRPFTESDLLAAFEAAMAGRRPPSACRTLESGDQDRIDFADCPPACRIA